MKTCEASMKFVDLGGEVRSWLAKDDEVEASRPSHCATCGAAAYLDNGRIRLHGHGLSARYRAAGGRWCANGVGCVGSALPTYGLRCGAHGGQARVAAGLRYSLCAIAQAPWCPISRRRRIRRLAVVEVQEPGSLDRQLISPVEFARCHGPGYEIAAGIAKRTRLRPAKRIAVDDSGSADPREHGRQEDRYAPITRACAAPPDGSRSAGGRTTPGNGAEHRASVPGGADEGGASDGAGGRVAGTNAVESSGTDARAAEAVAADAVEHRAVAPKDRNAVR